MVTDVRIQDRRNGRPQPAAGPRNPRPPLPAVAAVPLAGKGFHRASLLWASIPKEFGEKFRPLAEPLARDMVREIRRAVPEYAQPLKVYEQAVVDAVRFAITACIDCTVGTAVQSYEKWAGFCRHLGRQEFAEGRNMDSLQTAARVGGRVAWRHLSSVGQLTGASAEAICTSAEAVFAFVDEMSALAIEGYTQAQARSAGALERRRRRLLEVLLSDPPASTAAVQSLADSARWHVPDKVTVIALEHRGDSSPPPTPVLADEVLVDLEGEQPCLVAPGDDSYLRELEAELGGWRAAVGPTVPTARAALSLRWANRALALVQRGVLADGSVTWCRDHLSTLWLLADELLVEQLANRSLAPLDPLTTKQRARLAETLLTWLRTRGSAPEMAAELKVHPQTVRYRMHQLQNLFGERLNSPDDRLEMEIALRATELLGSGHGAAQDRVAGPVERPAGRSAKDTSVPIDSNDPGGHNGKVADH